MSNCPAACRCNSTLRRWRASTTRAIAGKSGGGGSVVIGFSVKTRRAVDQTYAKLVKAGHRGMTPPWDAFWGARYAIVADPDGTHVGIMSSSTDKDRRPPPDV